MNILNITEIKNQDTNNTQSYNDYIRELLLKLFNNYILIISLVIIMLNKKGMIQIYYIN